MTFMGLLDFFKTEETTPNQPFNWFTIKSKEQFQELDRLSKDKLMVIFKHSTMCPISSMALKRFQKEADFDTEQVDLFFVNVIDQQAIADAIGEYYGVVHQSPQLLIIKNGEAVYHSSHSAVVPSAVNRFLE